MRALVGSGYTLVWANSVAIYQSVTHLTDEDDNNGMSETICLNCDRMFH
jgi:hypothetical protein